jgi:hypothetical protein
MPSDEWLPHDDVVQKQSYEVDETVELGLRKPTRSVV